MRGLFLSLIIAISIIFSSLDGLFFAPAISQPVNQLLVQGKTLYQTGEYLEAVESLKQAADVYRQQEDVLSEAIALSNLSLAYQQLGKWELAESASERSLELIEGQENQQLLAPALEIQASLQFSRSQLQSLGRVLKVGKMLENARLTLFSIYS